MYKAMKYRGYEIVKTLHPTNINPHREAYDIKDGDKVRKSNISTIDTAKKVIDTMIRFGYWHDRSLPN